MIVISYLSDLVPGESAIICNVVKCPSKNRLCELGFVKGTTVECVAKAPMGGPCAYLLRGSLIALRRADAASVEADRVPSASGKRHPKAYRSVD